MQLVNKKKLHVVGGQGHASAGHRYLWRSSGVPLGTPNVSEFANGEIHVKYFESIRGADVFIVQTHTPWDGRSLNDAITEQLIMVDAAASVRRPSASRR